MNCKKLSISFSFFKRQLIQRSGPLAEITNLAVFKNFRGTEKPIKEKLVGYAWHGTLNSFTKICGTRTLG